MASITVRKKANGEVSYVVQIRIAGAKPINQSFNDPISARIFADEQERLTKEKVKRQHVPDTTKFYKERFADVIDLYLARQDISKKNRYALTIVKRNIGMVCMAELRTKWVKEYIKRMQSQITYRGTVYCDATIAVHLCAMSSAYKWRAEEYDMDIDQLRLPFSNRHLQKGWDVHRERRLTTEEEALLISAMNSMKSGVNWRTILTMALETAARQQELILATWSEISPDGRLWTIPAQHTKSKRVRRVPLTSKAIQALNQLKSPQDRAPDEKIFGFLKNPSSACTAFKQIVATAGLSDFRFHDLRHEAISRMVLYWRQYSVFEIMQIVGHSSIEMLNRYANLRGEELVQKMHPTLDNATSTQ